MNSQRFGRALLLAASLVLGACQSTGWLPGAGARELPRTTGPWVFTYFSGNGEDGMRLAYSTDALEWKALFGGEPVYNAQVGSAQLMRDPCAIEGPDGRFHMVWTTGWNGREIGYSSSADLLHWDEAKVVPVMEHEPEAENCWAPELVWDPQQQAYHIIWSTTIPGRFPETDHQSNSGEPGRGRNHRMYITTTPDFKTFSPTRLFYDHGFNVIDGTIQPAGDQWVMFLKNETNRPFKPEKNIRIAFADRAGGPYNDAGEPITGEYWAEGPTALRDGDRWYVYFDKYRERRFGAVTSTDLEHWTEISDQVTFPEGARHGTALPVAPEVLDALLASQAAATDRSHGRRPGQSQ